MTKIALIQGHPASGGGHFCHALALAYREGANSAGHEVQEIEVTALEFPVLRSRTEWETQAPAPDIAKAQETIGWAEHLVVVYPRIPQMDRNPGDLWALFKEVQRLAQQNAGSFCFHPLHPP